MLPFSIFLFLLFSATLLAPQPPALVGSFKIPTLRSFQWSSLPTSILGPQSPPEDTALFPLGMPLANLEPLPTQCWPNSTLVANNTVPHSLVRAADDRSSCTVVLLVVLLAMLNCFVYWLLVHQSNESHDAKRMSEQFTQSQLSNPAAPPQESTHHCTPAVEDTPHPFTFVDTAEPVFESLEHGSLPYSTKSPSIPSFATTILLQFPAPLEQSVLFPVISHGSSLNGLARTMDDDSGPSTLPSSGCASIDSPSVSATQTAAFKAPSALLVEPAVRIDGSDVGLPERTSLDTEAANVPTLPLLDRSSISYPRNPEPSGEMQDDTMSSPATEDACELDVDDEDVFCYQPSNSEGGGDETLDYKEVDSTSEAPKTPPAPTTEDRVLPSPQLRLRSRGHSLDSASSFSAKKSAGAVNTRLSSPRFSLLLDHTSEGQSEDQISSITRCASADDLVSTFEASNAAHASIITDCPSPTFQCGIFDDASRDQVTTLSSLRADAPIFKPRSPGMNEAVSLESVSVGLEASIHAPRNEEILQIRGHVEVLDAIINTPEAAVESESSGNAQPTKSASPRVTDGLRASIHAPADPSTGTLQALEDDTENLEKELTHSMTRPTRSGLYASIHAPAPGQSDQSASKHHTDVPNWAAICRAEKSPVEGSLPTKCGGNSPDSAMSLDEDASELSTTTRCATSDQEGSSLDDSDGSSLAHAGDQEDTTIGSGESDSTPGEVDASDEPDSTGTGTKPPRKSRRRGGRRTRQKIPYFPPPRMQNMPVTQHPVVDARTQGPGQPPNVLPAPASLSGHHYYTHAPPAPPHYATSAPGLMIPPNGIMPDQFGRYPHYYPSSPHVAPIPIPGFQPPGPHNPMFYPIGPHPHVSPLVPPTLLYGQ